MNIFDIIDLVSYYTGQARVPCMSYALEIEQIGTGTCFRTISNLVACHDISTVKTHGVGGKVPDFEDSLETVKAEGCYSNLTLGV